MNKLTYKEAYDLIIDAYFKDQVQPMDRDFCFCGTLNNNTHAWISKRTCKNQPYKYEEYKKMEDSLLNRLVKFGVFKEGDGWFGQSYFPNEKDYEDALFEGMSAALEVLKQIHIERGEIIDEPVAPFKKRELVN